MELTFVTRNVNLIVELRQWRIIECSQSSRGWPFVLSGSSKTNYLQTAKGNDTTLKALCQEVFYGV